MKRLLERLIMGLALFLSLAYAVTEICLRLSVSPPGRPEQFPFPDLPLWRERVVLSRDVPGLAARSVVRTTNALGMRADDLDLTAKDPPFRIVALGGSSTECLLLGDRGGWPQVMQDVLNKAVKKKVWVGNMGMSGHATFDYIVNAKVLLPQFRPDLVLVLAGGNDLQAVAEDRLFPVNFDDPVVLSKHAHLLYSMSPTALKRVDQLERSYTVFFLRRLFHKYDQTSEWAGLYGQMKTRRYRSPKLDTLPDFEDAVDIYRINLRTLIAAVRAFKGTPVFATHPYLWHENMTDEERRALWAGYSCMDCRSPRYYSERALIAGLSRFNAVLLETCREQSVACLDLEPKIAKNLTNFYDDAHLTEAGSQRVAEEMAQFLLSSGLLK